MIPRRARTTAGLGTMLQGWARADVISALALLVSIMAAGFTFGQMRIAQRKERSDMAAHQPVIEGEVIGERWPSWWHLQFVMRNRLDQAIVCEHLRVVKPSGSLCIIRDEATAYDALRQPPAGGTRSLDLGLELEAVDPQLAPFGHSDGRMDRRHIDLLVSMPSTKRSKPRQILVVSVSVRRSNESASYAEIIVVTKMPVVSTSNAT